MRVQKRRAIRLPQEIKLDRDMGKNRVDDIVIGPRAAKLGVLRCVSNASGLISPPVRSPRMRQITAEISQFAHRRINHTAKDLLSLLDAHFDCGDAVRKGLQSLRPFWIDLDLHAYRQPGKSRLSPTTNRCSAPFPNAPRFRPWSTAAGFGQRHSCAKRMATHWAIASVRRSPCGIAAKGSEPRSSAKPRAGASRGGPRHFNCSRQFIGGPFRYGVSEAPLARLLARDASCQGVSQEASPTPFLSRRW